MTGRGRAAGSTKALFASLVLYSALGAVGGLNITNVKKQINIPKIGTWVGVSE